MPPWTDRRMGAVRGCYRSAALRLNCNRPPLCLYVRSCCSVRRPTSPADRITHQFSASPRWRFPADRPGSQAAAAAAVGGLASGAAGPASPAGHTAAGRRRRRICDRSGGGGRTEAAFGRRTAAGRETGERGRHCGPRCRRHRYTLRRSQRAR